MVDRTGPERIANDRLRILAAFLGNLVSFLRRLSSCLLSLTFSGVETQEAQVLDKEREARRREVQYEDASLVNWN